MLAAIGGVSLKHWYNAPEFFWRAGHAYWQAKGDPLCLHAAVFRQDGLYFSLSVWHDIEAMLTYAQCGPHRRVMLAADRLADVNRFHHFPCIGVPTSEQAIQIWRQNVLVAE
ncbi:hypothetical protein [Ruegeria sp. 6PALISEP08]|uniref:hypothetical protein n=1 Tax=Ruegeria sp. 6PALISEP08 TaxID=1225660 RepID=UPI00067E86AD|nr:hypothetical protein [Ruegeria sp. 6PALISEP08]